MTPDDLARLKALAEAAPQGGRHIYRGDDGPIALTIGPDQPGRQRAIARLDGQYLSFSTAERDANAAFIAALSPATILALIAAASPVPAGEFGERLRRLDVLYFVDRDAEIDLLTRSHATLLAERDAALRDRRLAQDYALYVEQSLGGGGSAESIPPAQVERDRLTRYFLGVDDAPADTLLAQNEALVAERDALMDTLRLILPLAKGYAAANPVGSNAEYVTTAEAVLDPTP